MNETLSRIWQRARHPTKKGLIVMATLTFLVAAGVAAASTLLFTQTIPTATAPTSGMTSGCPTTAQVAIISGATIGDGSITFGCGSSPAFSVVSSGSYHHSVSLGTGYADIWIYQTGTPTSPPGCSSLSSGVNITATGSVALTSGDSFFYCLDFYGSPGATLASTTVTWSS